MIAAECGLLKNVVEDSTTFGMSYLRESVRKNKNSTVATYYEGADSQRVNGRVVGSSQSLPMYFR
ncbi:MAG: hypothetical protein B2I17_01845 [Thermoplasmatales archaeon B_DKE]|nr:MAG: hypothetical protein B2I17_01845 [Thermoplasmatales archaeon B_DKE]